MAIVVKRGVEFKLFPVEIIIVLNELNLIGHEFGVEPIITGASYNDYPKGKVHDKGYALDIRTSNLPDPQAFADRLIDSLGSVSPHYKVLYGDEEHLDHIHIGFAWWYSRRETRRRQKNGST